MRTFAVEFLSLINSLYEKKRISNTTFYNVKKELRIYLSNMYYKIYLTNNNYTFDKNDTFKSVIKYYSASDYFFIVCRAYILGLRNYIYDKFGF